MRPVAKRGHVASRLSMLFTNKQTRFLDLRDREHRSIANMVEVLIREHCARNGIAIPEQAAFFSGDDTPRTDR